MPELPKEKCYACQWRRAVPGSAHTQCAHPNLPATASDPLAAVLAILGPARGLETTPLASNLGVRGNPHGIRRGWFAWPFNFDPVWLEACEGFTPRTGAGGTR